MSCQKHMSMYDLKQVEICFNITGSGQRNFHWYLYLQYGFSLKQVCDRYVVFLSIKQDVTMSRYRFITNILLSQTLKLILSCCKSTTLIGVEIILCN